MTIMDVFKSDPFSAVSLTSYVEKHPFKPTGIGDLGIFAPNPIRTTALAVEEREGVLVVVPTSARGTPPTQRNAERRKARYFDVPRLAFADTIHASELQNVREFGTETVLMQLQTEVARRLSGPTGLQFSMEYTMERHRLGCIRGVLLDADGSTLYNWFDEFGITEPTAIDFDLETNTAGTLRAKCATVVRDMARASGGAFIAGTRVHALCGDTFWDKLVAHQDVEKTYMNWVAAEELRNGTAFEAMKFGGIYWSNYRGSDDGSTIAVASSDCRFFPVGAPGVFEVAYAPGETFDWVNTPGKPEYVIPIPDRDRNAWWKQELYSYPLHICTRPGMLRRGYT